jgi:hypothetical protein
MDKKYTPFNPHRTVGNFIVDEGSENPHGYETPMGYKTSSETDLPLSLVLAYTCTPDRRKSFISTHIVCDPRGGGLTSTMEYYDFPGNARLTDRK